MAPVVLFFGHSWVGDLQKQYRPQECGYEAEFVSLPGANLDTLSERIGGVIKPHHTHMVVAVVLTSAYLRQPCGRGFRVPHISMPNLEFSARAYAERLDAFVASCWGINPTLRITVLLPPPLDLQVWNGGRVRNAPDAQLLYNSSLSYEPFRVNRDAQAVHAEIYFLASPQCQWRGKNVISVAQLARRYAGGAERWRQFRANEISTLGSRSYLRDGIHPVPILAKSLLRRVGSWLTEPRAAAPRPEKPTQRATSPSSISPEEEESLLRGDENPMEWVPAAVLDPPAGGGSRPTGAQISEILVDLDDSRSHSPVRVVTGVPLSPRASAQYEVQQMLENLRQEMGELESVGDSVSELEDASASGSGPQTSGTPEPRLPLQQRLSRPSGARRRRRRAKRSKKTEPQPGPAKQQRRGTKKTQRRGPGETSEPKFRTLKGYIRQVAWRSWKMARDAEDLFGRRLSKKERIATFVEAYKSF